MAAQTPTQNHSIGARVTVKTYHGVIPCARVTAAKLLIAGSVMHAPDSTRPLPRSEWAYQIDDGSSKWSLDRHVMPYHPPKHQPAEMHWVEDFKRAIGHVPVT